MTLFDNYRKLIDEHISFMERMRSIHDEIFGKFANYFPDVKKELSFNEEKDSEFANTQVEANDDFFDSDKQLVEARTKCKEAIKENFINELSNGLKNNIKNNCFDSSGKNKAWNDKVTEVGEPCSRDEIDCFAFMDDDIHRMIDPEYKTFKERCEENRKAVEAEQQKKVNERLNVSIITRKAVINNTVIKVSRALRNMIRSEGWKNRYKDESKENKKLLITALLIKSIFYLFNSTNKQGTIFKDGDIVDQDLIRLTNDIILNDEVAKALYDIRVIIGQISHVLTSKNHLTQHSYIEALDGLNIDNITKLSYTFLVGNNSLEVSFNSKYPKKTCDIDIKAVDNSLPIIINSNTGFEDLFSYILENSKFRTNIVN